MNWKQIVFAMFWVLVGILALTLFASLAMPFFDALILVLFGVGVSLAILAITAGLLYIMTEVLE